jgi:hypothetical protein
MEEILGLAEEMNQTGGELPWEEIFSLAEGMTLEDAGFPAEIDQLDLTATPEPEVTPTSFPLSFPDVSYGNVNLAYPPGSGFIMVGDTVPALTEPEFWAVPEHVELAAHISRADPLYPDLERWSGLPVSSRVCRFPIWTRGSIHLKIRSGCLADQQSGAFLCLSGHHGRRRIPGICRAADLAPHVATGW